MAKIKKKNSLLKLYSLLIIQITYRVFKFPEDLTFRQDWKRQVQRTGLTKWNPTKRMK